MDPQFSIPLGCKFRFEPEDDELLVYLKCKTGGEPLPWEGFIKEVDLYSINDPGVLFKGTDEKLVYVFTKLKKVAKNGKRVERTVSGNRTWKGVDAGKSIHNAEGRLVGEKKNFVLMNKMKMKLDYNMTEFSLDNDTLRNSTFKDYVVCKIKKKTKKFRGLNDRNIQEEIQDSSVSTPAIEGDAMASVSEQGYHYGDNSTTLQYQGQQAQESYQFSESNAGMGNNLLAVDFDSYKVLSEGYLHGEVNSCTTVATDEESNRLFTLDELFGPTEDKQEVDEMIEELLFAGFAWPSSPAGTVPLT